MKKEVWAWVFLAAALVTFNCVRYSGPVVSDDSFQYLSIAENLAAGNGIRTSIVHFDEERSHGVLPAPVTWFPAGYPAAIALLVLVGLPSLWAGWLVSSASFCILVFTAAWFCSWYRLSAAATRLVLFALVLNSYALLFSSAVVTEAAFTALSVGAVAMLAAVGERTRRPEQGRRIVLWALCGLAVGLSVWLRYAGLFLYGGLGVYLGFEVLFRRRRELLGPIVCATAATIPLAALFLRNAYLIGNWRGGNSRPAFYSVVVVARKFAVAVYELFFGELLRERVGVVEVVLVLAAGVCGVFVIRAVLVHRASIVRSLGERPSLAPVLSYVAVSLAGLAYLSFFSPLGVSYRYCYPLLPLLLVLMGLLATVAAAPMKGGWSGRVALASAAVVVGCYLFLNVRDILRPSREGSMFLDRRVAEFLDAPMASGESLRSWIEAHVPADANLVATAGQATAHVLRRKAVSLVTHEYSRQDWEEPQLRELMTQFEAEFLIVYRDTPGHAVPRVQNESKFLAGLARGQHSPDWLRLAAENPHAKVFGRGESSPPGSGHVKQAIEQLPR